MIRNYKSICPVKMDAKILSKITAHFQAWWHIPVIPAVGS
jgi:hypothetical protein